MQLRDYQQSVKDDIYQAWSDGAQNVAAILPTRSGKTVLFSSIIHDNPGPAVAIAHRQELVSQISLALAREGIRHKVIGQASTVKFVIGEQTRELGTNFYDPNSQVAVAGVDTLIRRADQLRQWTNSVTLWVTDECHHLLRKNKWGKGIDLFPNARGLGVTATPCRADGKGLGRDTHGVMDTLVEGPQMRELINHGYLNEYRIFGPQSDLIIEDGPKGALGDYTHQQLKKAAQRSHIVGDVVDHYLRIAPGKKGITFATDVETATEMARRYNEAGVPAEVVSAKTPNRIRAEIIRRFRNGDLLQLVNVDLFGEGFDLPAIEVISMARPTYSYPLYAQQFARCLTPMEGKTHGVIIDHVGNVLRHGLPDKPRIWTLDAREGTPRKVKDDDTIPLQYCVECTQPYEKIHRCCPYCGHYPEPEERSGPEFVDGDLFELSLEVLAEMRGEIARIDEPGELVRDRMQYAGAPVAAWRGAMKQHRARQDVQAALRESIAWWGGIQRHTGLDDSQSYRKFYHLFGVDVLTAQTLGRPEALTLAERINNYIGNWRE